MGLYIGNNKYKPIVDGNFSSFIVDNLFYDAEIEYLESNGHQYINTNVLSGDATEISLSLAILNVEASGRLVGSSNTHFELWISSTGKLSVRSNNEQKASTLSVDTSKHTYKISNLTDSGYIGSQSFTFTHNGTSYQGATLYLLMRPANPGTGIETKLYNCKIKENGMLVRDFIPVRVGTVGYLYDKVSKTLFENMGSENFILGPDVT